MSNFSPHYILVVSFFLFLVDPPLLEIVFYEAAISALFYDTKPSKHRRHFYSNHVV